MYLVPNFEPEQWLWLLSTCFRFGIILLIFSLTLYKWLQNVSTSLFKAWLLFATTMTAYLLAPLITHLTKDFIITLPVLFLALSAPYALLQFSMASFDDQYEFNIRKLLSFLLYGSISFFLYSFTWKGIWPATYMHPLIGIFPRLMSIGSVCYAAYLLLSDSKDDLVEDRVQLRKITFYGLVFLVILISASEIFTLNSRVPYSLEIMIQVVTWFGFMFYTYSALSNRYSTNLVKVIKEKEGQKEKEEFQHIKQDYQQLLSQESFYLEDEISLAKLSKKLGYPEYLLRKFINQEMGYRNFNHFINSLRIEDACEIIKKNDSEKLNFTDLALSLGFGSQATFNRSFKSILNYSPSQYQKSLRV